MHPNADNSVPHATDPTVHPAVDHAVEHLRAHLASIVESSLDAIVGKDLNGIVTSWNRGAERIFGYPADEMIGKPIRLLIPADRQEEEDHILEQLRRGEVVEHLETLRITRDGRLIDVSVTVSPIRDAQGRVVGASKIARDMTTLRRHERELERMSRLYDALSQVNQAIVWTPDRDTLFNKVCRVLVERGGLRMAWIGWKDPDSPRLLPVAAFGDDSSYLQRVEIRIDDRPEGQGTSGVSFRSGQPDVCNDLQAEPRMAPWRDALAAAGFQASASFPLRQAGTVAGVLCVHADQPGFFQDREVALLVEAAMDVSFGLDNLAREAARRQAEQALGEESLFSQTMLESMPGVVYCYDNSGRFLRWNRNFEVNTGRSADEIAVMHPRDFFSSAEQPLLEERMAEVFASGEASVEADLLSSDGSTRPYFFTGRRIHLCGQSCLVGVGVDLSERKALEARFQQAQKLESVGQLTGGIAHDFNNLLTVIIGNAEVLAEELVGDERLRPLAEMTRAAATRGADLIQRLLSFARRQALEPRVVDVRELLVGMDHMLRRMLPESIQLSPAHRDGLWPAIVDASQLESAVMNLVINARDAMPEGGSLTIETANVTIEDGPRSLQADLSPGAYVMVAVSDTGTGIAPELLPRLFDPFFTTKPVGKGSGLGLSMVYGFAKQSRGHVKIYSELGQGTTVRLYLPRASEHESRVAAETQPADPDLHGGERILLVEDDELVRHLVVRQLTEMGYQVVSAENGPGAMELVKARSDIDLLLTDVVMPGGLSGPQLADAARALRPGLKVLFSSGYTDLALTHGGHLDPGVNLLGKPYGRRELARKVRMVLDEQAAAPLGVATSLARSRRLLVLDDDAMVAKVLGAAAERLGFEVLLTSDATAFLERAIAWAPSHVAIDLFMPAMGGVQVLDRLADARCDARVILASGADAHQIDAVLEHARAKGLSVGGALTKPFTIETLRDLLFN